jgi:uroporphyrinogen decarboxylase
MIFDTAAGELAPDIFKAEIVPQLRGLTAKNASRIGYYSKGTQPAHLNDSFFTNGGLAGLGVDSRWSMIEALDLFPRSFVQGNFDQALLFCEANELKQHLTRYLVPMANQERPGWICGLGHGVLPGTPEDNVRLFVNTVREVMQ